MLERLPLTRAGITLTLFGLLTYVLGWRFGWVEFMVLAAACLIALVVALPFVLGRLRLDVTRELDPKRVTVGDPAVAVLTVTNPSKTPVGHRVIEDRVAILRGPDREITEAGETVSVEITGLKAGESREAMHRLPTSTRGIVSVGPAIVAKADPLGLMRREVRQAEPDSLWVHPRVVSVSPVPVGFAKDLEGPTSDTSPAGDVAFHTLREYQVGDDHRHIHWLSSARAGSLMVRHYVDNRRPHLAVVLDDRSAAMAPEQFEVAVSIATTLTINSQLAQQPIALWTGSNAVLGQAVGGSTEDVLDQMALVTQAAGVPLQEQAARALSQERGTSAITLVTGGLSARDLLPTVQQLSRSANVIVVRVWSAGDIKASILPGATVLDVDSLDRFQVSWNHGIGA